MESLEYRLEHHVDKSITAYLRVRQESSKSALPIDLYDLARAIGNLDIEEREMVPEAAVQLEGTRFKIYLQKNFKNRPGMPVRQRFSLAHEIAHTFFFELQDQAVKPVQGAPRGLKLEAACHEGASRLLVPERFLRKELKVVEGHISGEDILRWSEMFAVSVEVMARRLQSHEALRSDDVSFALLRAGKIKFVMYPPWLKTILPAPSRDIQFTDWLNQKGLDPQTLEDGSYQVATRTGLLTARRIGVTALRDLFEIRFKAVRSGPQMKFGIASLGPPKE